MVKEDEDEGKEGRKNVVAETRACGHGAFWATLSGVTRMLTVYVAHGRRPREERQPRLCYHDLTILGQASGPVRRPQHRRHRVRDAAVLHLIDACLLLEPPAAHSVALGGAVGQGGNIIDGYCRAVRLDLE